MNIEIESSESSQVGGLKYQVARQVGMKCDAERVSAYNQDYVIISWKMLYENGINIERLVWDYIGNSPKWFYVQCESKDVGVYSIIDTYENKKGFKSLAHYTINRKYIGSVKTLGENPISYKGHFHLTQDKFRFVPELLLTNTSIERLFVPF